MRKGLFNRLPEVFAEVCGFGRERLRGLFRELLREEDGQVIVEYILMLSAMLLVATILGTGFRRMLTTVWERIAKDVAAPCPGCKPPPEIRFR